MVKRKKRSLKNVLSEFIQTSKKAKGIHENLPKKSNKTEDKPKSKPKPKQKHHIKSPKLYSLSDYILLVGEGNFSFANALAKKLGSGKNIIATALDSKKEVSVKYDDAEILIDSFKKLGGTVIFGVDCTNLQKHKSIKNKKFTKIIFNFPHLGHGIADQARSIKSHQELLLDFFESASDLLTVDNNPVTTKSKKRKGNDSDSDDDDEVDLGYESDNEFKIFLASDDPSAAIYNFQESAEANDIEIKPLDNASTKINLNVGGEIHVSMKSREPYDSWNIRYLAKKSRKLIIKTTVPFVPANYPGYEHRRTTGFIQGTSKNENLEIIENNPKTYVFTLKPSKD